MWFLLPVALGLGYGIRLLVESTPKSEVIVYTTDSNLIDKTETSLKMMGLDYEIDTDGVNSWIMVKPDDRIQASKAVNVAKNLSSIPTNE